MWTMQQKAQFVLWYAEFKSIVVVQQKWCTLHPREKAPDDKELNQWMKQFKETGSLSKGASPGRPSTSEENFEQITQSGVRSPKNSTAYRSLALGIAKTTIQNVLHMHLRLHAYKIQLRHEIKPDDKIKRVEFAFFMLSKIYDDESFLKCIIFTDEVTFHVNRCVNHHNCYIWGSGQPTEVHEYVHCSPKKNVWCGLLYDCIVGPFFFPQSTVTGNIYQDLLEIYLFQ